jgi:hypothetical protein
MKKTRVEKSRAIVPLIFNYYLLKKKPVDGRLKTHSTYKYILLYTTVYRMCKVNVHCQTLLFGTVGSTVEAAPKE